MVEQAMHEGSTQKAEQYELQLVEQLHEKNEERRYEIVTVASLSIALIAVSLQNNRQRISVAVDALINSQPFATSCYIRTNQRFTVTVLKRHSLVL